MHGSLETEACLNLSLEAGKRFKEPDECLGAQRWCTTYYAWESTQYYCELPWLFNHAWSQHIQVLYWLPPAVQNLLSLSMEQHGLLARFEDQEASNKSGPVMCVCA